MTAAAAPAPARAVSPYGLGQAEVLKLRKRRALVITVGLMTLGIEVVFFGIRTILHAVNPDHHGPAGGIHSLSNGTGAFGFIGSVAVIIVGSTVGTADLRSGVFRELVVTGRSRLALFGARVSGGLAFLLPFVVVTYAFIAVMSVAAGGSQPSPSTGTLVETGLWAVAAIAFYFTLGLGLGSLVGSQGTTIGVLLAFRLFVFPVLASIGFLGNLRMALPNVAFSNLVPHAVASDLREVNSVHMSSAAAVVVVLAWVAVWLGLGAWRTATRDV